MNPYTEDYYLHGIEKGLSNYENYVFQPDRTLSMVSHLRRYLGLKEGERVIEIGASRGYYCKALRMLGIEAYGYDISEWAVQNCHPDVKPFMSTYLNGANFDVAWSKDCWEHISESDLKPLIKHLCKVTSRKIFAIVPLAESTDGKYIHEKEEKDVTHVNRWTLHDWIVFLQGCTTSFVVTGGYFYPGLKPGAAEVENGYGFLSMDRI